MTIDRKAMICGRVAERQHELLDELEVEVPVAHALGRADERERLKAIVLSEPALSRPKATATLAFGTDLPAAEVIRLLAALPVEISGRRTLWRSWR